MVDRSGRDEAWFDGLFRDHSRAIVRFLARRTARDEVDDLAADVFLTAWTRREDVPDGHELAWLYRTAGYVLANHRRKGRPTPVDEVPEGTDLTSPELLVVEDLHLRAAFATLTDRDRQILLLAAWEGLQGDGLAQVLQVSRSGADAALSRARARFRAAWDQTPNPARSRTDATQTR